MSEAQAILARARARADARHAATRRIDYGALNGVVRRQRAALTRAIHSGDAERVVVACRDAVREWEVPGAMWPDDWSRWQRALDDALPLGEHLDLRDLV